jgi:hypothetical protein
MTHTRIAVLTALALVLAAPVPVSRAAAAEVPDIDGAVAESVALLISLQEGAPDGGEKGEPSEWPYEGVYLSGGQIPIGYRVGGTAICASALVQAPGYADDAERHGPIARATRFILDGRGEPLMDPAERDGAGYDVRGWGYTYALRYLLILEENEQAPEGMEAEVTSAIEWYVEAIQQTEIPKVGGWNYAGSRRRGEPYPMSPFMTAPTLQALFQARRAGYEVDDAVVERALAALERARTPIGSFVYAGSAERRGESVPGSMGRMLASETTLLLAGRGSVDRVRGAIDAFIVHWEHFDKRRQQTGTHVPPYGIAPYYFYYAHYYAAQAVEQLPEEERPEYRRRLHELIFRTRLPVDSVEAGGGAGGGIKDGAAAGFGAGAPGGWNDRVFPRSMNYGTAMCVLALLEPETRSPARWITSAQPDSGAAADPE